MSSIRENTDYMSAAFSRRAFMGAAAALGLSLCAPSSFAFAVPTSAEKQAEADEIRNKLVGLQAELEEAAGIYWRYVDEQEAAQAAMEAEQAKIDEASARIAKIQQALSLRVRSMYRSGSVSFLDFLLGANSFEELTQNWDLLMQLNEDDQVLVAEAKELRIQLEASKEEYSRQERIAAEKAAEAKVVKDKMQARVDEATELMNKLDAEAQALLAEEQAEEARRKAQEAEELRQQQNSGSNNSGSGVSKPAPSYSAVVDYAYSRIGCPYVWGGEGPDEFDCSGLVQWCYAQIGIRLPHYTESMYACATQRVPVSEARPGDVLYRYGHVGIAAGYGGVPYVHAPSEGAYVRDTDPLSWSGFTCALRFAG